MRRPRNLTTSRWLAAPALWTQSWTLRAACGKRQDLPWTMEDIPSMSELLVMAQICSQCPVLVNCAHYALKTNDGRGADGGFYAGVWLPWAYREAAESRRMRAKSRRVLRALAGRKF